MPTVRMYEGDAEIESILAGAWLITKTDLGWIFLKLPAARMSERSSAGKGARASIASGYTSISSNSPEPWGRYKEIRFA